MRSTNENARPRRLLFVVNADWFFVSHRLPLARACRERGFDVGVCAGETGHRATIEEEGIAFFPLDIDRGGTSVAKDVKTLTQLARVYRAFEPDVVHHVTIKPVLYGSVAARLCRVSGVVNAVSGLGYAFIPRSRDGWSNRALRTALRAAYRVALSGSRTRVIFQNEDDRSAFVTQGLVRRERTKLIRGSGVDLVRFPYRPMPAGEFIAVLPARLLWDKGVGEFVEAARAMRQRWPKARFVLVGRLDPDNPAAVSRTEVEKWLREGCVEWWDSRRHDEMPDVYGQAHVVVLPSYREGLPLALVEAAATGRAVITTDTPGCRDTVLPNETGWLVTVRDPHALEGALEAAHADRERLRVWGKRGRTLVEEKFSLQQVVEQTLRTYDELD